jgi:hypothetical protein
LGVLEEKRGGPRLKKNILFWVFAGFLGFLALQAVDNQQVPQI